MKKYEYVSVSVKKFIGARSEQHRKIIDDYAKKGYKYIGYIPKEMNDWGKLMEIDLIFEIDC